MSKFASFLAGFGKGYIDSHEKQRQQERQDKQDAMQAQIHQMTLDKAARENKLRQDIADANALRQAQNGYVVTQGDQKLFFDNPMQALDMQGKLNDSAEFEGKPMATFANGSALTGGMARGHQINPANIDLNAINSEDLRNQRILDAYRNNGEVDKALGMQASIGQMKLNDINLKNAQIEQARNAFNAKVTETLAKNGGNIFEATAQMLTESQAGPLKGNTYAAVKSADGKEINIVATQPDGSTRVSKTFSNNPSGELLAFQSIYQAKPETLVSWHTDRIKQQAEQANKDRDHELNKTKTENDRAHNAAMAGIAQQNANTNATQAGSAASHQRAMEALAQAQDARAKTKHDREMSVSPMAQALSEQIKAIDEQVNKAQAQDTYNPTGVGAKALQERREDLTKLFLAELAKGPKGNKTPPSDPLDLFGASGSDAPVAGTTIVAPAPKVAAQGGAATTTLPAPAMQPPPRVSMADIAKRADQMEAEGRAAWIKSQASRARLKLGEIKASKDPEIIELKEARAQFLRDGKTALANAANVKINEIERQRYGVGR